MNKLTAVFLLSLCFNSFSQDVGGSIDLEQFKFKVPGQGAWVCMAQGMSSDRPVLARGASEAEAKILAKQECGKLADAFFCKVEKCEFDKTSKSPIDIVFDITKDNTGIKILFNGQSSHLCQIEAWSKTYYAKAPTQLEARVLTANQCANGNDGSAFFCDVDPEDCEALQVEGPSGELDLDLPGMFNKLKNIFKKKN
ncbi:MAG: hypothetical protein H6620_12090 [Halobacteriovoraceae bacterium]|nr:hypothetical protein [Halobacteriovoraceae bacterium]